MKGCLGQAFARWPGNRVGINFALCRTRVGLHWPLCILLQVRAAKSLTDKTDKRKEMTFKVRCLLIEITWRREAKYIDRRWSLTWVAKRLSANHTWSFTYTYERVYLFWWVIITKTRNYYNGTRSVSLKFYFQIAWQISVLKCKNEDVSRTYNFVYINHSCRYDRSKVITCNALDRIVMLF